MIGIHILEQSLVFFPLALGVFLSFSIMKRADLTVDGSMILGAGAYAKLMLLGVPMPIAMLVAVGAGCLAGVGTALIQYRERISPLIAGILALFILHSLTLIVMGRPNISLLGQPDLLHFLSPYLPEGYGQLAVLILMMGAVFTAVVIFLRSSLGLMLRAFGNNGTLVNLMGSNAEGYRVLGLAVSNGLVAFCGTMTAQFNGYADLGMGTGVVLIGLGTVIIGQQFVSSFFGEQSPPMVFQILFCFVGVVVYFTVVNVLISVGVSPIYLKMMIGLALVAFLCLSRQPTLVGGKA